MTLYTIAISEKVVHVIRIEATTPGNAIVQGRQAFIDGTADLVDREVEDRALEVVGPICTRCGHPHATTDCWRYGQDEDGELVLEAPPRFENFYRCDHTSRPGHNEPPAAWSDEADCTCNDRCPDCNAEIEPYKSLDLDK